MAGRKNADGLTPKQLTFCRAYVETGNASEAYRRAYNASAMKTATIGRKAMELMSNGTITAYITALKAETDGAATKALGLTREWIIEGLMSNARAGAALVQTKDGGQAPVNLAAANQALIALGKVDTMGLFAEKLEVTGKAGAALINKMGPDELAAYIAAEMAVLGIKGRNDG
jgi:phage terminase small subunit